MERRRPKWATAHCEALVAIEEVYRDRASWALCRDRLFLVAKGCAGQAHDRACELTKGLRGQLERARDRNSRPRVATGVLCRDKAGVGTGRPRSRQGVLCRDKALWVVGRDHGQCRNRIWTRQGGLVSRHGNGVAIEDQSSFVVTENSLSR